MVGEDEQRGEEEEEKQKSEDDVFVCKEMVEGQQSVLSPQERDGRGLGGGTVVL